MYCKHRQFWVLTFNKTNSTYIESISFNLQICARRKSRTLHCSTKKYILYLISKYVFNMYLKSFFIYLQDERCKDNF